MSRHAQTLMIGLLGLALAGCSGQPRQEQVPRPASPYCLRGGNGGDFSCDPAKQQPESARPQPREPQARSIDDDKLYAQLAEIKTWLRNEKAAAEAHPGTGDAANVRLPPAKSDTSMPAKPATPPPIPALLPTADYQRVLDEAGRLYTQGHKDAARDELKQLIAEFPNRPEAYNNLGVMQSNDGQYSAAIKTLQQGLATHPHYARIHDNLRSLYAALAGDTYTDLLGMRRIRTRPSLTMLQAAKDAGDDRTIAAVVGQRLEQWAASPMLAPAQRARFYIPGYRPDDSTAHGAWIKNMPAHAQPLNLQEYRLAVMSPDWVEISLIARRGDDGKPFHRQLTLIHDGRQWLISSERP